MLRFIRDLIFPSAYDLRARTRRPGAAETGARREGAEPASAAPSQAPTATAAKG